MHFIHAGTKVIEERCKGQFRSVDALPSMREKGTSDVIGILGFNLIKVPHYLVNMVIW